MERVHRGTQSAEEGKEEVEGPGKKVLETKGIKNFKQESNH